MYVRANLNSLRALACTRAVLVCIKCNCAVLAYIIQLSCTLNALVLRSRTLNAFAQHATNMRVLLQIHRGTHRSPALDAQCMGGPLEIYTPGLRSIRFRGGPPGELTCLNFLQ